MHPIIPLTSVRPFYPRLGKISAGYKAAKVEGGKTITFPVRSETLVFRSDDRERLETVAKVLGGDVTPSPDPKTEGTWRVVTKAKEVEVIVPADDERGWSAMYEYWGASGKLRECDGTRCAFTIDLQTGERREDVPCVCAAQELEGDQACKLTSRLNVFIAALIDAPGLGIWQVESRGVSTFLEIQGAVSFIRSVGAMHAIPGSIRGVPLILKIKINEVIHEGKVRRFPTLGLVAKQSLKQAFERARALHDRIDGAQIPPPDRETPPLGAALTPEQARAAEEAEAALPALPPPSQAPRVKPAAVAATPAGPAAGAPNARARPERPGAPRRDYTNFWKAVNAAAAREGDADGKAWLARLTNGTNDPRQIDDATFTGLLAVARRVVNGESGTRNPTPAAARKAAVPVPPALPEKSEPPPPPAPAGNAPGQAEGQYEQTLLVTDGDAPPPAPASASAGPITREQMRVIQQLWRNQQVHPNAQYEQVRLVTGGRAMLVARLTEDEAARLIDFITAASAGRTAGVTR